MQTTNHDIEEKQTNDHETNEVIVRSTATRLESNVSSTESQDLPPELPRLPPLNKPSNFH